MNAKKTGNLTGIQLVAIFFVSIVAVAFLYKNIGNKQEVKKTIAFTSKEGTRHIVYDCEKYGSQVRTREDIQILLHVMAESLNQIPEEDIVPKIEISNAVNRQDFMRLEELLVSEKCRMVKG